MRVAINAHASVLIGGIATYVRTLVATLPKVDPKSRYFLYSNANTPLPSELLATSHALHVLNTTTPFGLPRLPLAMTRAIWRNRIDVIHEQVLAPRLLYGRLVVTLHDLTPLHFPESYSPDFAELLRTGIPRTIHRAAAIITDSVFSRQDILAHFPAAAGKIFAIPLAADSAFHLLHDPTRLAAIRARYDTGDQFLLWTGAPSRHKNLTALVTAYCRLRRSDTTRARLLLAGGTLEQLPDDVQAAVKTSGYADDILLPGRVPQDDLVALYNAATAFVFPSISEGFGLPALEAMACGTPVVCANTTSLPEVVGEAALQIDPRNSEVLTAAMARILRDEALRADLAQRGLVQAARFSWEATARATLEVYRHAARPPASTRTDA
jgi:glycosyltransferase involved in cell wall biosynthesis